MAANATEIVQLRIGTVLFKTSRLTLSQGYVRRICVGWCVCSGVTGGVGARWAGSLRKRLDSFLPPRGSRRAMRESPARPGFSLLKPQQHVTHHPIPPASLFRELVTHHHHGEELFIDRCVQRAVCW